MVDEWVFQFAFIIEWRVVWHPIILLGNAPIRAGEALAKGCRLVFHQKGRGSIFQFRCSIVVSISACHAEDPGSIPGGGAFRQDLKRMSANMHCDVSRL